MSIEQKPAHGQPSRKSGSKVWGAIVLLLIGLSGVATGLVLLVEKIPAKPLLPQLSLGLGAAVLLLLIVSRGLFWPWSRSLKGFIEFVSALLSIIATIGSLVTGSHPAPRAKDPCAVDLGGPAYAAPLSMSSQATADLRFADVEYSLYSYNPDPHTAQLLSGMSGRVTGGIAAGSAIYALVWYNPHTRSLGGVPGYPHYYPRGRLFPDSYGCWSIPSRNLGEPHTVGIGARFFLMLIPESSAKILEQQKQRIDENPVNNPGFTPKEINALGAVPLEFFDVDTLTYDRLR